MTANYERGVFYIRVCRISEIRQQYCAEVRAPNKVRTCPLYQVVGELVGRWGSDASNAPILVLSLQRGHDLVGQRRIDAAEIVCVERDHLINARFCGRVQQQGIVAGAASDPQTG